MWCGSRTAEAVSEGGRGATVGPVGIDGGNRPAPREDAAGVRCAGCGRMAADRFCGYCGARQRTPAAADHPSQLVPTAADDGPAGVFPGEPVTAGADRRRTALSFAAVVATLVVGAVLVGGGDADEVVMTSRSHGPPGMTSTVAATDLDRELWRHVDDDVGDGWRPMVRLLAVTGDVATLRSRRGARLVDTRSGAHLGKLPPFVPVPDPRIDGGVDVLADDGVTVVDVDELVTIDVQTSAVIERAPLDRPAGDGLHAPIPLSGGDLLLAGSEELRRVSPDGATVWSVPATAATGSVPIVDGDDVHVIDGDAVASYDLADGTERWATMPTVSPEDLLGVNDRELVAIASDHTVLLRFDTATGDVVSEVRMPGLSPASIDASTLRLAGDTVVVSSRQEIRGFARNGTLLWRTPGTTMAVSPGTGDVIVSVVLPAHDGRTTILRTVDAATGSIVNEVTPELPPTPPPRRDVQLAAGALALPDGRIVALATGEPLGEYAGTWGYVETIGGRFASQDAYGVAQIVDPYGQASWGQARDDRVRSRVVGAVGDALAVTGLRRPVTLELDTPRDGEWWLADPATGNRLGESYEGPLIHITGSDGSGRVVGPDATREHVLALRREGNELVETWRAPSLGGAPRIWDGRVLQRRTTSVAWRRLDDPSATGRIDLSHVPVTMAYGSDMIVLATSTGGVYGLDPDGEAVRWEKTVPGGIAPMLTVAGDVVYIGTSDGRVELRDIHSGELHETVRAGTSAIRQIVVAYGLMVVATTDELVTFGPTGDDLDVPTLPPRQLGDVDVPVP